MGQNKPDDKKDEEKVANDIGADGGGNLEELLTRQQEETAEALSLGGFPDQTTKDQYVGSVSLPLVGSGSFGLHPVGTSYATPNLESLEQSYVHTYFDYADGLVILRYAELSGKESNQLKDQEKKELGIQKAAMKGMLHNLRDDEEVTIDKPLKTGARLLLELMLEKDMTLSEALKKVQRLCPIVTTT